MKKGIIRVMFANIFCLILSVLTNFILPKYLPVDAYGMLKTYALYLSYAGFFHLGYCDGMYLKYGGKKLNAIDKNDLSTNYLNYLILNLMMMVCILVVNCFIKDKILFAFAFGMYFYNTLSYLKYLYQATGEFALYSRALNFEKVSVFVLNIFFIFAVKTNRFEPYIWNQIVVGALITFVLTFKLKDSVSILDGHLSFYEIWKNISSGFVLMIGNFSSNIFTGLDRWFVKILMTTTHFALYSFAVSMENMINVFISPITLSLYNYFCQDPSHDEVVKLKKISLAWGFFVIGAAFPAKFILERFLKSYLNSNGIIFLLFSAQAFYVIIKGVYINIYKAQKKQFKYLKQTLIMTVIGFLLNAGLFALFHDMTCIAAATLITSIIWLLLCEIGMPQVAFSTNEWLFIIGTLLSYLVLGYFMPAITGCVIYVVIYLALLRVCMKDTFNNIENIIKSMAKDIRRRC